MWSKSKPTSGLQKQDPNAFRMVFKVQTPFDLMVWFSAPLCRRTSLLVLLCCALGGVWTLEQPSGSLLEYYPTWRETMNNIFRVGGPFAVLHSGLILVHQIWLSVIYVCMLQHKNTCHVHDHGHLRCSKFVGGWGCTGVAAQRGTTPSETQRWFWALTVVFYEKILGNQPLGRKWRLRIDM